MWERRNFIANALELRLVCTNPSISYAKHILEIPVIYAGLLDKELIYWYTYFEAVRAAAIRHKLGMNKVKSSCYMAIVNVMPDFAYLAIFDQSRKSVNTVGIGTNIVLQNQWN